jgi:hypothetical protein
VKVTDCPKTEGFGVDVRAVALSALVIVMDAVEVLPVPAVVSLTVTVLVAKPTATPWTFTETVQDAPELREAPLRAMEPDPAVAATDPVQVVFKPFGVATTKEVGRVSVNPIPFRLKWALGLLTMKLRLVVAPKGMLLAANDLLMCGGLITVRFAVPGVGLLPAAVESMVTLLL